MTWCPRITKDFGHSQSCLHRWLKLAHIDDGVSPRWPTDSLAGNPVYS